MGTVEPIEVIWLAIASEATFASFMSLRDLRRDRQNVIKLIGLKGGSIAEQAAKYQSYANVRAETARLVQQFMLTLIALPALFTESVSTQPIWFHATTIVLLFSVIFTMRYNTYTMAKARKQIQDLVEDDRYDADKEVDLDGGKDQEAKDVGER